mgnify:CR=1 FL=1
MLAQHDQNIMFHRIGCAHPALSWRAALIVLLSLISHLLNMTVVGLQRIMDVFFAATSHMGVRSMTMKALLLMMHRDMRSMSSVFVYIGENQEQYQNCCWRMDIRYHNIVTLVFNSQDNAD